MPLRQMTDDLRSPDEKSEDGRADINQITPNDADPNDDSGCLFLIFSMVISIFRGRILVGLLLLITIGYFLFFRGGCHGTGHGTAFVPNR